MDNQAKLANLRREAMTYVLQARAKEKEMKEAQSGLDTQGKLIMAKEYSKEIKNLKKLASDKISEIKELEKMPAEIVVVKKSDNPNANKSAMEQMKSLYISQ